MPEGFAKELLQGLKRREEGGTRSDLEIERAVLEEVWRGREVCQQGEEHSKTGAGMSKGLSR